MKQLVIKPLDFPCKLEEAPPGMILFSWGSIGFKTEYHRQDGKPEAYNEAGEALHLKDGELVTPCHWVWVEL